MPKLRGHTGYTEVPLDRRLERLPVYRADLGAPLGEDFELQDGVYVCFDERGLVLVGEREGPRKVRLRSPYGRFALELRPEADPATGGLVPAGRVPVSGR